MAQVPSKTPAQNQDLNSNLDLGLDLSQSQGAAGMKMSDLSPTEFNFSTPEGSMPENGQLWRQGEKKKAVSTNSAASYAADAPGRDQSPSNFPASELSQSDILQEPKLVYPVQVSVDEHVYRQQQWQQGRWGKMPIKSKVMAIAALLGFLPTLTLGFINYTFQSDALTRQLEQEALQSGSAINDQLSLFMRERFGDIQIIAQANVLSDAATRAGSSTQAKADVLNQFLKAYPVYNNIAAFDLNGEPIAKSDGEALGNHADRAYFQDAKQSGRVVISQPIVSKSTGEVSVYVASPIRDNATQAMVGIARARISIAYFNELLGDVASTAAKDKSGSIQYDLYNADGERFASSRAGGSKAQTLPKVSQMQAAGTLDRLRNRKVVDQSQQTGQAVAETTPESVLALVPFRTYSDGFRGELPPLQWKNLTTMIDRFYKMSKIAWPWVFWCKPS
ncbi:MAG: hypothetical protein HC771_18175 [Synechococcales cyanobacterium CRU_2_2]|nr:hypothetical protein [Synechococcales cyanobacterium CRU_2_2]